MYTCLKFYFLEYRPQLILSDRLTVSEFVCDCASELTGMHTALQVTM